jgi:hypothetical protein
VSQFWLSTSVHAPWKFAPEGRLGLGLAVPRRQPSKATPS